MLAVHQSVRLNAYKAVLPVLQNIFWQKSGKKLLKLRKKTTFKILLFSSKWSSEHVGTRFDSFVENSERHVRKVLLKVRLHNEKKKKLKKPVSSTYFWIRRKQFWQSFREFLPKARKILDPIPKKLENFSKKIFLIEVFVSVLRKQFSHFCKKRIRKFRKSFGQNSKR